MFRRTKIQLGSFNQCSDVLSISHILEPGNQWPRMGGQDRVHLNPFTKGSKNWTSSDRSGEVLKNNRIHLTLIQVPNQFKELGGRTYSKASSSLLGLEWTSSHQCTSWGWGHWSCFRDEPKTHPPTQSYWFFQPLLYTQKISLLPPPSYLCPSSYLPPTSVTPSLEPGSGTTAWEPLQSSGGLEWDASMALLQKNGGMHHYWWFLGLGLQCHHLPLWWWCCWEGDGWKEFVFFLLLFPFFFVVLLV